ncbi:hypothetical protein HYC85_029466 [Camellia sinensis]|uniref:Reverse transcriptase/retrotransposon-derived protein RNase H-like domain-containing protein n=1 Tax=Camellia sinensis TaxID=4442 RepID=A0A7J7FYP6_CAMSI|nr:hypothetical protein HYC85_029466 [Camellia sinensis]
MVTTPTSAFDCDLIDERVIVPPEKPNVTTNPFSPHNQASPAKRINVIETKVVSYDPSIYITSSHLPKPEVFIPDSTNLCMLDISQTQADTVVVAIKEGSGLIMRADQIDDTEPEGSENVMNDPSGYITLAGQARPTVELLVGAEIYVVREDGPNQGLDGLADLEEDIANLDVTVNWFGLDGSAESTGWLDDQPDGLSGTETSTVAGRAEEQSALPESTGVKNFAQDMGSLGIEETEQQAILKQSKRERIEDSEKTRKPKPLWGQNVLRAQERKIQADISIWGLVMASRVHRQAVLSAMDKGKLSIDTTSEQLVGLVFPEEASPTLTFSDKELPPEGANHNKPLYISMECRDKWVPVVLVDTGSTINGTLNGRFVQEGGDFPFCGFPEPWLNTEKRHLPGFEIFFDLQLSRDDVAEEQTDASAEVEQCKEVDSENTEIEMAVALACLLLDPPIVHECLGDDLSVSMIGNETAASPSLSILDTSIPPSLIWQYEEGFLSSSTGSGSEPKSDSTESVDSESDSSSSESESESKESDELDDVLNENCATVAFDYFSMPLIYCINSDFQNFDENDEKEIPPVLKYLLEQEQERFVKPLVDEITQINVGIEKDPRLVQIGSTLSSKERECLVSLLKDFKDVFTWSYKDMPGIDPEIVQHRIPLDLEARPVKQKLRRIFPDWALKIKEEATKEIDTGFLLVSEYPTWLANIVPVPKKDGRIRVCVDFRDLNKASPKDDFRLPHIDELVDFTAGHALL